MGWEKETAILDEERRFRLAERDGRRCPFCSGVILYGTEPGPNGECPACVGALGDD